MTAPVRAPEKTKIAILGGGPAGLAAALSLTATPELRARHDVTIYQSGWRVGGKCGQGRRGPANRIEINGTHYLFGSYDAAFRVAREVFTELEASGDTRFGSYESQFLPCSVVALKEFFNGSWYTWALQVPGDGRPPGAPGAMPTMGDTIRRVIEWIVTHGSSGEVGDVLSAPSPTPVEQPHWWQQVGSTLRRELRGLEHHTGMALLRLVKELAPQLEKRDSVIGNAIVWILRHVRDWARSVLSELATKHIDARRAWQLIDLGTTVLIGMLEDDVLAPGGFDRIDDLDFREWLLHWGASEGTVWSAPLTTWYNAIAAYEDGDTSRPNMSAGMGLRGMLRLGLTYQGAFSFQLSYEVGDSIIAPAYQVLVNRGVRFMYFHRVLDVVPSGDGTTIESVTVERQVTLKSGDPSSYQPFMHLPNGRPVWPDEPLLDQIDSPPANAADLLSFYAAPTGRSIELRRGTDFDLVVYALPVATTRWYCAKLVEQKSAWRDMRDNIGTTETQSLRLWLYPTVEQMGWTHGQAVLSGYYQPLATWEDARQLIAAETWPATATPGAIATLFGAFAGAPPIYPDPDDTGYPARRAEAAEQTAMEFCRSFTGSLWPNATQLPNPVAMDWTHLVTLDPGVNGVGRLAAQSIRGNVGPVEAYTQIHKGTLRYRLGADESGYEGLFLAGDWVRNGYEIGSVEGAILGGIQAAEAIIGQRSSPTITSG